MPMKGTDMIVEQFLCEQDVYPPFPFLTGGDHSSRKEDGWPVRRRGALLILHLYISLQSHQLRVLSWI